MRPVFKRAFEKFKGAPIRAVEVGVYQGTNAEVVLQGYPGIQLTLVDDFRERPSVQQEARERLNPYSVTWRCAASLDSAAITPDRSMDVVYLDADHTWTGVHDDIQAWFPKVRSGGILGGDDYANRTVPGVRRAVNQFVVDHDLILHAEPSECGGDWWVELE